MPTEGENRSLCMANVTVCRGRSGIFLNPDNAANLSGSATEGSGIGDGIGRDVVDLERL